MSDPISGTPEGTPVRDIDFLLDIPVRVVVELGKATVQLGEVLRLGLGSVVELEKAADEPLDVHVNGKLIGRGEVVVVNNKFGIKLTEIASPTERVEMLK